MAVMKSMGSQNRLLLNFVALIYVFLFYFVVET